MGETYLLPRTAPTVCGAWFRFAGMNPRWECGLPLGHEGAHIAQDGFQWSDRILREIGPEILEGYSPVWEQ